MNLKKIAAFGAVFGVALAGIGAATAANADPVTDGYVIVGSDTLQDAVNALANGTNISGAPVQTTGAGKFLGSWNATPTGTLIQTRAFGPSFPRPANSGDGRVSLSDALQGIPWTNSSQLSGSWDVSNQIDLARSSGGWNASGQGGANPNGPLEFIPFGRDAVSYAILAGSSVSSSDLASAESLTKSSVQGIFLTAAPHTIGAATVTAYVPPAASGTRQFFQTNVLGVAKNASLPNVSTNFVQENTGSAIPAPAANEIVIVPFSAASYIAQSNGAAPSTFAFPSGTTFALGSLDGVAPYTGSGTNLAPNSAYYSTSYGRDVYIIAPYAKIDPTSSSYDAGLADIVNPTKLKSLTYFGASTSNGTSKAVKVKFGFLAPKSTAVQRADYFTS